MQNLPILAQFLPAQFQPNMPLAELANPHFLRAKNLDILFFSGETDHWKKQLYSL